MMPPHKCGRVWLRPALQEESHCCAVTIHHNFPPLQFLLQLLLHSGAAVAPPAPRLIQQNPSFFFTSPNRNTAQKDPALLDARYLDTYRAIFPPVDSVIPAGNLPSSRWCNSRRNSKTYRYKTPYRLGTERGRPQVDGVYSRGNKKKLTGTKQNPVQTWGRDRRRKAHTARRVHQLIRRPYKHNGVNHTTTNTFPFLNLFLVITVPTPDWPTHRPPELRDPPLD